MVWKKVLAAIIEQLDKMKVEIKVKDQSSIEHVATISAGSAEIGRIIADAVIKVGRDGLITAEEGKGLGLETKETSGMEFDNGFLSPYFATNTESMEAVIERPHIIITDKKISSVQDILPFFRKVNQINQKLRHYRRGY